MPYVPQQAPAGLDLDGLRKWTEEEFRRLALAYADTEQRLTNGVEDLDTTVAVHEAAWTPYTPAVTITGGAGTATGRYIQIGKTVHIQLHLTVTTGGTTPSIGLPPGMASKTAYPNATFLVGREDNVNGLVWIGLVGFPSLTTVTAYKYDATTSVTTGWRIDLSGTLEIA